MASEENKVAANEEEYLYLYEYAIGEISYTWFGYFKNYREAEATIQRYNAAAPHIKAISLNECPNGIMYGNLYIPYKKSEWDKMYKNQS